MLDSRGDIGFMEAMVAAMIVTVILTAFMGTVVLKTYEADIRPGYPDIAEFAKSLSVSDNEIRGNLEEELENAIIKTGVNGISLSFVPVPDSEGNPVIEGELHYSVGKESGKMTTERFLCSVSKGNGYVLVNGEMTVWS